MEILGLLHLAADHDLTAEPAQEHYRAVRADGSERSFAVPRFAPAGPRPAPDVRACPEPDSSDPDLAPEEAT